MISQEATSFTARRPSGQWLAFQLYPAPSGHQRPRHAQHHDA
ncbi:hypothetical protein ACFSTC_37755 [Nonomuraea ferruginea]